MLSIKRSFVVAALSLLIGQTQAQGAANVTPILAPKGAKVLTVGVIGGDNSDSASEFVVDRGYRLWLDRLGALSRCILL
jgi:bifunctional ADP-heptose synthase (sugar kinase/adenylyltransferase)